MQDDSEDDFLGFNFDYTENLEEMRRIEDERREYSRSVKYNKDWHLSEDCWSMILNFLTIVEFSRFSRVCCALAEILTYDQRNLFFKKLSMDYPNLFDNRVITTEGHGIASFISDRLTGSGMDTDTMIHEYMLLIFKKGLYIHGMFIYIEDNDYISDDRFLNMLVKDFVEKGLEDFGKIPKRLLNDKEFIMTAMKMSRKSPYCYTHISDRLQVDPDILLTAVRKCPQIALKVPYTRLDIETKKKICSIVLKPPKSALLDNHYRYHAKNPLAWIPDKHSVYDRNEFLDYYLRTKSICYLSLVTDLHLEMEFIQLLFFKRKDYYNTTTLISNLLSSQGISFDIFSIFETNDCPELLTKQIEKFPFIGKGTFTFTEILTTCFESDSFYMETILEQSFTTKHGDFIKNLLKKEDIFHKLAKMILDRSIREKFIDPSEADTLLSEVFSSQSILKKLLKIHPSCFPSLPDNMKQDKELIEIAFRFPKNLEVLGKSDENYLKILDKCFREAKTYIGKQIGIPILGFMTKLYFNVDANKRPTSLKDSVLDFPKVIVPIVKYFSKHYSIEKLITEEQLLHIVKVGNLKSVQGVFFDDPRLINLFPEARKELLLKTNRFVVDIEDIGDDELCYQLMLKNPNLDNSPTYYYSAFLAKNNCYYGKLLLTKRPRLIKRLYYSSHFHDETVLAKLSNEIPEIVPYLQQVRHRPYRYY